MGHTFLPRIDARSFEAVFTGRFVVSDETGTTEELEAQASLSSELPFFSGSVSFLPAA